MYKLCPVGIDGQPFEVKHISDNLFIPFNPANPANTDYQAYLKWLEEGNTPLPADE